VGWAKNPTVNLPPKPPRCELWLLYAQHGGRLDVHHIIPKAWTRNSPAARAYVDEHPELLAWVCRRCNAATKMADTEEARKFLLARRVVEYGESWMQHVVDDIPWKKPHPEWTWRSLWT